MDRNVSRLYLYHGYNYVGYFDVYGEYDMIFHVSDDELDYASTMLLKFNDLSTNDKVVVIYKGKTSREAGLAYNSIHDRGKVKRRLGYFA